MSEKILTRPEFLVFEVYLDFMGFDRNKVTFGRVNITLDEIAQILGYRSASGVSPYRAKLVELGLLIPTSEESIFAVNNAERYLPDNLSHGKASYFATNEKNQPATVILKNISPRLQPSKTQLQHIEQLLQLNEIELQPTEIMDAILLKKQASEAALGSFKVNSRLTNQSPQPITASQWESRRLEDPDLPAYENRRLIDEAVAETTLIDPI